MTEVYALAALWVGPVLLATLFSIWLRVATAMSEIVVGMVAQLVIGAIFGIGLFGTTTLGTDQGWIQFLSSIGAVRRAETRDVQVHFDTRIGHPADQILRYADEHGVDHIIVDHRGKGLLRR
jgi:nucleotide-binding universal stress UspA family protein